MTQDSSTITLGTDNEQGAKFRKDLYFRISVFNTYDLVGETCLCVLFDAVEKSKDYALYEVLRRDNKDEVVTF